jgi:prolipoprotein diacylglyceryltransferase
MLGLLIYLEKHKTFPGFTVFLTLIFYGLLRLIVDFFRYFEESAILFRMGHLHFTVNQGISLVILILAMFFFLRSRSRRSVSERDRSAQLAGD